MPDLLTHSLSVYLFRYKLKKFTSIILVGAVLPDVFARIPGVLLPHRAIINWAQTALHTPSAVLIICYLLSLFFSQPLRKNVFSLLVLGSLCHLFLDLLQKTLTVGYFWLFPFSFKSFSLPFIWPNDTTILTLPLLVVNLIVYVRYIRNRR